jgi:plasmid stability protein
MARLLVYAAKGRKPAAVGLAAPRPFFGHGKRQVHADDSVVRFVRGRCHVCIGAGGDARHKGVSSVFDRAKEIATIGQGERKSAMMIELPEKLEAALKVQANAHGVSPAGYVCEVLERDLASSLEGQSSGVPFKTGRGMFAKYGPAPSAEEIDANRTDMFRNFGEHF